MTTTAAAPTADLVRWDLSDLYASHEDPRIASDRKALGERIARFSKNRGAVAGADARALRALVEEYEAIGAGVARLAAFAELLASTDQNDERRTALRDTIQEQTSRWVADLVFFELEMKKLPEERVKTLLAASELSGYRHWIVRLRTL